MVGSVGDLRIKDDLPDAQGFNPRRHIGAA